MNRKNVSLVTFVALLVGGLVLIYFMIEPLVPYVLLGGILALLCEPLYAYLRGLGWGKRSAAVAITLLIFILSTGPLYYFLSQTLSQGIAFSKDYFEHGHELTGAITEHFQNSAFLKTFLGDPQTWAPRLQQNF